MELVLKDVKIAAFTELECTATMPDSKLNKYLLAAINKGSMDRASIFRLAMTSDKAPYYKIEASELAKPDLNVFALGIVGQGALMLGLHSLTTIVATQDQLFKRVTWGDLGQRRSAGFAEVKSVNKKKTLYWYLKKMALDEDKKQAVFQLFAKGI